MSVCEPSEITSDKVDVCGIAGFVISVCGPHTVKNEQLFVAVFRDGSNNEMIDTIQVRQVSAEVVRRVGFLGYHLICASPVPPPRRSTSGD